MKCFILCFQVLSLVQARIMLIDKMRKIIDGLTTLQSHVLDKVLIQWKREQQLAGNGAQFVSNLDTIQEWLDNIHYILFHNVGGALPCGLILCTKKLNPRLVRTVLPHSRLGPRPVLIPSHYL